MNAKRFLLSATLIAAAFCLLLTPSVAADNPGNNNPGGNNTNLSGNERGDGSGGGNPGNINPGENNTDLPGDQPSE